MTLPIGIDRHRFAAAVREASLYRLFHVKFKIIDGCNVRCVMCNHWRRDGYRKTVLTTERLLALADELAALGTRHVNWSGGEPTLRKDLPQIMARLRDLRIESSLITNGTLLSASYAEGLRAAGLSLVVLSLESAVPEIHNQVVGIEHAWEKLVAGVGYLTAGDGAKPKLMVNTVLTAINTGPELPDLVPFAHSLGVKQISLSPIYVAHLRPDERKRLVPTADQVVLFRNEYLPQMLETGRRLGVAVLPLGTIEPPQNPAPNRDVVPLQDIVPVQKLRRQEHITGYAQHPNKSCYLPFYHCTIDYNGNVDACCHMRDGDGILGNIQEMSLAEVLHSETARHLRRRLTTGDMPDACAECAMQISENQAIDAILGVTHPVS